MGPNYKRPQLAGARRSSAARLPPADPAASIADTKWQDLFPDPTLNQMVTTALAHNFDLQIAAERVEEARAQLGITRANQYPFVGCAGRLHERAKLSASAPIRSFRRAPT